MDTLQLCRVGVKKTTVQLKHNSIRDENNNQGFYRHISQNMKAKESIPHLMRNKYNKRGEGWDISPFFASVFTGNLSFHTSWLDGLRQGMGEKASHSKWQSGSWPDWPPEEPERNNPMESDGIHPKLLRELVDVAAKTLTMIFENSSHEVKSQVIGKS